MKPEKAVKFERRYGKFFFPVHRWVFKASGGRIAGKFEGRPMVLVATTGAKSGQRREQLIQFMPDGDDVIVIASKLGMPEHPAWFHNARAHPDVKVNGDPYRAEVVDDEAERQRLWQAADKIFPAFATYRDRAAETGRTIPILRLRPT